LSSAPIKPGIGANLPIKSHGPAAHEAPGGEVSSTEVAREGRLTEQRFDALQAALNFVLHSVHMEQGLLGRLLRILPTAIHGSFLESSSPMLEFRARQQALEEAESTGSGHRSSRAGRLATANAVTALGGQGGQGRGQSEGGDQQQMAVFMAAAALEASDRSHREPVEMQRHEVQMNLFGRVLKRDVEALLRALHEEPEIERFAGEIVSGIERARNWANAVVPLVQRELQAAGVPRRHPGLIEALDLPAPPSGM
jgi:hypothetical protein